MLMEHIIDTNNIDIEREDVKIVGSLIKGEQPKDPNHEKRKIIIWLISIEWMYEIVANKTNSLDVDKLDYLERDAKHLGLQCVSF